MSDDLSNFSDLQLKTLYQETKKNIVQLHNKQMSIKILMNSLYGGVSNVYFLYYVMEMAEAITMSGQLSVKWVSIVLNNYLNKVLGTKDIDYVIYIDTDSVVGDTLIYVNGDKIKIEDYYNIIPDDFVRKDHFNEDYVKKIQNGDVSYSVNTKTHEIENNKINYIMKHKVKKRMFKIKVNSKSVTVTNDHSIEVLEKESGNIISIKPEFLDNKKHSVVEFIENNSTKLSSFAVEDLGVVEEYVYDIEVDKNHNFFGNDILVHNSVYINFEPMIIKVFGSTDVDKLKGEEFLDKVCAEKIEKIIDGAYSELFETLGAFENAMKMKREKINDYALFLKKKKYVLSTLNSEGVHYEEPKISVTGLESVRSSTPEIVRKKMKESYEVFLKKEENELQEYIEKFKQEFIKLPADKIAKNSGTDSIEKFMENGTYTKGCPAHVRGCIVYNNYIKYLGFEKKFDQIKSGDKVKSVYLKLPNPVHENIISFQGVLPKELGLDQYIDYDMQFEKVYRKPMRDIANVLDWQVEKVDNIMDIFDFS